MNICNYWTTFDWKGEMVEMRRWSKMVKVWGNAMNLDEFGGWCFISTVGDSIVCMKIWCLGAPIHSNPIVQTADPTTGLSQVYIWCHEIVQVDIQPVLDS